MDWKKLSKSFKNYAKHGFMFALVGYLSINEAISPNSNSCEDSSHFVVQEDEIKSCNGSREKDKRENSEKVNRIHVPVDLGQVSSVYGVRKINGKKEYHAGVDIAPVLNRSFSNYKSVFSPERGVVVNTGYDSNAGKHVKISHPRDSGSFESILCHLTSYDVEEGDTVKALEEVGEMGNTGRSSEIHLHYALKLNGNYRNPANFLKKEYNELESNSIVGFEHESLWERFPKYASKLSNHNPELIHPDSDLVSIKDSCIDLKSYYNYPGIEMEKISEGADIPYSFSHLYEPLGETSSVYGSDKENAYYSVQVAASKNALGESYFEKRGIDPEDVNKITARVNGEQVAKYFTGNFSSIEDADEYISKFGIRKGGIGEFNGQGNLEKMYWQVN